MKALTDEPESGSVEVRQNMTTTENKKPSGSSCHKELLSPEGIGVGEI